MSDNTCNGWENYETWNVMLWINNTEILYYLARDMRPTSYQSFICELMEQGVIEWRTKDGIRWLDPWLDYDALDEAIIELWND